MMTPVIHLIIGALAILATGYHTRHRVISALLISAIADSIMTQDHLFPAYEYYHIKIFHNVFIAVLVPVVFFMAAAVAENRYSAVTGRKDSRYQRLFLMVLVITSSHLVLDMLDGGKEYIFYPLVKTAYQINPFLSLKIYPLVDITPAMVALFALGIIVIFIRFVENRIYAKNEGSYSDAAHDMSIEERQDRISYGVKPITEKLFIKLGNGLSLQIPYRSSTWETG